MYSKIADLRPSPWQSGVEGDSYGFQLAVSGDGVTIAVGDTADQGRGTGPRAAPLLAGTAKTGAVYIYRLASSWKLANMVKPDYPRTEQSFGREMALSGSGRTLLVGEGLEDSNSDGIGGDWHNTAAMQAGAVWMY